LSSEAEFSDSSGRHLDQPHNCSTHKDQLLRLCSVADQRILRCRSSSSLSIEIEIEAYPLSLVRSFFQSLLTLSVSNLSRSTLPLSLFVPSRSSHLRMNERTSFVRSSSFLFFCPPLDLPLFNLDASIHAQHVFTSSLTSHTCFVHTLAHSPHALTCTHLIFIKFYFPRIASRVAVRS
jgi:hypothetical protein